MKEVIGIYNSARIFTDDVEDYAAAQIKGICDNPIFKDSVIRVMPDVHPGKYCTIGTAMTIGEQVIPYMVGVDIGCGMTCVELKAKTIEFQKLDAVIEKCIPSGMAIRGSVHHFAEEAGLERLRCRRHVQTGRALLSLGTLGGGNHFIEVDRAEDGRFYLVIHSGSRRLGAEAAQFYQNRAFEQQREKGLDLAFPCAYAEGEVFWDYIHDLEIIQEFAALNRACIAREIIKGMKFKENGRFDTVHNYISRQGDGYMLRKGAVSARKGEPLLIPVNMKDGALLCEGLGNEEWNCSAPHGSGRIASRSETKQEHTVYEFKKEMKGIYCSVVGRDTLDEAPFAYRRLEQIRQQIGETARVNAVLRPVYNYKAGKEGGMTG